MGIEITTNNHPRPLLYWSDLTKKEQAEFSPTHSDDDGLVFFRYRGWAYTTEDFTVAPAAFKALGFDGICAESFWSAIVVRWFTRDGDYDDENIVVGTAHITG